MSSIAIERLPLPSMPPRARSRREFKQATALRALPWSEVAITQVPEGITRPAPARSAWLLIAGVAAIHALLAWSALHHAGVDPKPPHAEVAVEFISPPQPLQPQLAPPQPPAPTPVKHAQILPPIQTAAPESSTATTSTAEPAVAVAPIIAPPPAPATEPLTEAYGRAGLMNNPPPDYPAAAARVGWEGVVTLRVKVMATGAVAAIEVQQSSGHRVLDDAATRTVKNWTFSPSRRGSTPIDGWATVPIEFKLDT